MEADEVRSSPFAVGFWRTWSTRPYASASLASIKLSRSRSMSTRSRGWRSQNHATIMEMSSATPPLVVSHLGDR